MGGYVGQIPKSPHIAYQSTQLLKTNVLITTLYFSDGYQIVFILFFSLSISGPTKRSQSKIPAFFSIKVVFT